MPYRKVHVPSNTPPRVKALVRNLENLYLRDVHCMLRLPEPDYGLTAGCNFAITQVLTGAISGMSTTLYMHSGGSGSRFKNLLVDYYPWDLEFPQSIAPKQAAEVLYAVFRNPLAHDLGLGLQKKATTRKVLIKRLTTKNGTHSLSEEMDRGDREHK
jgi:hypothetical protein